jgi:alpha 1,2-mannosyltransferase
MMTPAPVEFGLIPREHWDQPASIDADKASKEMAKMARSGVKYGGGYLDHFRDAHR